MLAPRLGTSADTQLTVNFTSGHVDLSNIDFQVYMDKVIHEVQTQGMGLTQYARYEAFSKGTFKWVTLTGERNPVARIQESPTINSRANTFSRVGLNLKGYDDDALIPDYTESGTNISVKRATFEAMYKGFARLMDKLIVSACIQPRITQVTTNTASNPAVNGWRTGEPRRAEVALPLSRIGGRVTGSAASFALANPNFNTLQQIKKFMYEGKIPRSTPLYGLMNPQMEVIIENLAQYQNKDFIFAATMKAIHEKAPIVPFYGINWIRVNDDILSQSAYNTNRFAVAGGAADLAKITSGAAQTNDVDLGDGSSSSTKYTVLPIWSPEGLVWASNPTLYVAEMYRVDYYKRTPLLTMTEYIGATRIQDEYFFNLLIPRD